MKLDVVYHFLNQF